MERLILAGGGNAQQSHLVDEFFAGLLPRKTFLFVPHATAPHPWSFSQAYEWIHKPRPFHNLRIEMWEDLADKTYQQLQPFDAIYLMGGNTFVLLHELRKSNFGLLLREFLESGRIIYGISAGAIVLGKDITTATIGDEADQDEIGISDLSGFGFLENYNVHCHYAEEQDAELFEYLERHHTPFLALSEDTGVYVDGHSLFTLGYQAVYLFEKQNKRSFSPNSQFLL